MEGSWLSMLYHQRHETTDSKGAEIRPTNLWCFSDGHVIHQDACMLFDLLEVESCLLVFVSAFLETKVEPVEEMLGKRDDVSSMVQKPNINSNSPYVPLEVAAMWLILTPSTPSFDSNRKWMLAKSCLERRPYFCQKYDLEPKYNVRFALFALLMYVDVWPDNAEKIQQKSGMLKKFSNAEKSQQCWKKSAKSATVES
jgi:hypothetical protein